MRVQLYISRVSLFAPRAGYTNETASDPGRPGVALADWPRAGVNGTDGEHPRGTRVTGCSAREIGLYEKQSSFYVQAKTALSVIQGNVSENPSKKIRTTVSRSLQCIEDRVLFLRCSSTVREPASTRTTASEAATTSPETSSSPRVASRETTVPLTAGTGVQRQ